MNVDIRITVDVTQGGIDLFLSPRDDSFVVTLNASTGYQEVRTNFDFFVFLDKKKIKIIKLYSATNLF